MIVVQCAQPPENGVSRMLEGYGWWAYASRRAPAERMPRMNATGETPPEAARRRDAAADLGAAVHGVDRAVGGVEELAHVRRRRRRAQPASLVRLVPDEPASHPAVARRGGAGEAGERRCAGSEVRRPAAVGPARRADEPDHGRDAARPEPVQDDRVRSSPACPAVRSISVPVQVEADDVDAERLSRSSRSSIVPPPCASQASSWIPKRIPSEASAAGAAKPNRQTRTAATVRRIVSGYLGVFLPTRKDPVNARRRWPCGASPQARDAPPRTRRRARTRRARQALQDAAHGRARVES